MKKKILYIIIAAGLGSCAKLDLNPPSEPASESFYSNQNELELAVNNLYQGGFWGNDNEFFSDNTVYRENTNAVITGTMNADDGTASSLWTNAYKAIARVNTFLAKKDKAAANTPADIMTRLEAEMRLIRAYEFSRLVTHFGDVPLLKDPVELADAYNVKRDKKEDVLSFIYSELDFAAANLPTTFTSSQVRRLTKGAAFAIKARTALYAGNWELAKAAADSVINLANAGVYSLNPSYRDLFLKAGETSKEIIFSVPRDKVQNVYGSGLLVQDYISRNAGGFGARFPTREMFDSYECIDGLPIDESPLYNYNKPFANRDPRLTASIVEFGTPWLGYSYQPHPDSAKVFSYKTNTMVKNNDTRGVAAFASYTGLLWKKGIDQSWSDKLEEDNDVILFRYAEMLLTYAEAKIELGEIDQSVLDAINQVRSRAYGVAVTAIGSYPAIQTTDATELRKIVRRERRVEFPLEGLRYMDLIRWRLAEKALTMPIIGLPDPKATAPKVDPAKWPFSGVTQLGEDGLPEPGYIEQFGSDVKKYADRKFDPNRQYLWPIPNVDRRGTQLTQNPNY